MTNVNISEFNKNINELFKNVIKDNESINITTNEGNAVIISEEEYNNLMKMLQINSVSSSSKDVTKETIKCFCGNTFEFDWEKIPNTDKTLCLRCPVCKAELKRGNPNYKDNK